MKKILMVLVLSTPFVVSVAGGQDKTVHRADNGHVIVHSAAVQWGPAPPDLPPGAQAAVLVGDPSKPGVPFVLRAKLPDGYKVPPHWHPTQENVTVLAGTLLVGTGEKFDPSTMEELTAGSLMSMNATVRHCVMAKGEAVLQIHGLGPFEVNYVNPADDPRRRDAKK